MTKGSDLLVAALENEGVEHIFGVPGEENLDVVEVLRNSTIELVLTRHEQSAAFMAATHGRLTGRPGVCISHARAGSAESRHRCGLRASRRDADGADHRPEGDHEQPAGALPDRRHGRDDAAIDQDRRARSSARRPSPRFVRDAFRVAMEERPGPVHLELPEDIAGEEAPDLRWCHRTRSSCRSHRRRHSIVRPR